MDENETKERMCTECGRNLIIGDDVIVSYKAVLGVTQAIPLEEKDYFHSADCFISHMCNSSDEKAPKRIP